MFVLFTLQWPSYILYKTLKALLKCSPYSLHFLWQSVCKLLYFIQHLSTYTYSDVKIHQTYKWLWGSKDSGCHLCDSQEIYSGLRGWFKALCLDVGIFNVHKFSIIGGLK